MEAFWEWIVLCSIDDYCIYYLDVAPNESQIPELQETVQESQTTPQTENSKPWQFFIFLLIYIGIANFSDCSWKIIHVGLHLMHFFLPTSINYCNSYIDVDEEGVVIILQPRCLLPLLLFNI